MADKILPFPQKETPVKVFKTKEESICYAVLRLIERQTESFDTTLSMILERHAEHEDVREIKRAWDQQKEQLDQFVQDIENMFG